MGEKQWPHFLNMPYFENSVNISIVNIIVFITYDDKLDIVILFVMI